MAYSHQHSRESYPSWAPADLSKWLDKLAHKLPESKRKLYMRLATDDRMQDVWAWHERICDQLDHTYGGSSVSFVMMIETAMQMPRKPGNMPPKQRAQYFESVRHHADALITLLSNTRFDCAWKGAKEVDPDQAGAEQKIGWRVLSAQRFVDSDCGGDDIPVAYTATTEGLYQLAWDYPESHLIEILHEVHEWTQAEDYWGRGLNSSKPVRQTGPKARVIYFNCTLYEEFARVGIEMPFPVLATLANVAMELPIDRQADEDTVRKQVRRHLHRVGHPDPLQRLDDSDLAF